MLFLCVALHRELRKPLRQNGDEPTHMSSPRRFSYSCGGALRRCSLRGGDESKAQALSAQAEARRTTTPSEPVTARPLREEPTRGRGGTERDRTDEENPEAPSTRPTPPGGQLNVSRESFAMRRREAYGSRSPWKRKPVDAVRAEGIRPPSRRAGYEKYLWRPSTNVIDLANRKKADDVRGWPEGKEYPKTIYVDYTSMSDDEELSYVVYRVSTESRTAPAPRRGPRVGGRSSDKLKTTALPASTIGQGIHQAMTRTNDC